MDVIDRISEVCFDKKIKQVELVRKGIASQQTVYAVMKKKQKPGLDFLERFINLFQDVNGDWLLTGQGEKYKKGGAAIFEINDHGDNSSYKNYASQGDMTIKEIESEYKKLKEDNIKLQRLVERYERLLDSQEKIIEEKEKRIKELSK